MSKLPLVVVHESYTLLGNAILFQIGQRVRGQVSIENSSIHPLLLLRCTNHRLILQSICNLHVVGNLLICPSLIFVVNGVSRFYFTQIVGFSKSRLVQWLFVNAFYVSERFFAEALSSFQIIKGSSVLVCTAHVSQLVRSYFGCRHIADLTLVVIAHGKVVLFRSLTTYDAAIEISGVLVSADCAFLLLSVFWHQIASVSCTKVVPDATRVVRSIGFISIVVTDHVRHIAVILKLVFLSEFSQFVYHPLLFHLQLFSH